MQQLAIDFESVRFNGADYQPARDNARLTGQLARIFAAMQDGKFRTLREIALATEDPEASISAQLRHLRKPRFGSHTVEKRHRGEPANGLYEYSLVVNRSLPIVGRSP